MDAKWCMCVHWNRTHKYKLVHTHVRSVTMWRIIMDKRAQTHTHVHAPKLWHLNKFTHVLIRSPAFHSFQQPITYRNFSFTIPLTCLCISRLIRGSVAPHLTSQHSLFFFFTWNTAASLLTSLSISQPGSQSIHKLPTLATDAHSQKWKKKKKRNTQGGISNGEKQKQRNRGEQSVILGSICVAETLVWS